MRSEDTAGNDVESPSGNQITINCKRVHDWREVVKKFWKRNVRIKMRIYIDPMIFIDKYQQGKDERKDQRKPEEQFCSFQFVFCILDHENRQGNDNQKSSEPLECIPKDLAGKIGTDQFENESCDPKNLPQDIPGKRNCTLGTSSGPRIYEHANGKCQ